ncbi:MAG: DUF2935 domain-containing protein [Oscillospiraceae bacterium]
MEDRENFVISSLELNLFFARIMKEHALFLKAGFTPVDSEFAGKAEFYKQQFERILRRAIELGNGIIGRDVLNSGELVTEFTDRAEKQTQCFTGIAIDREITRMEQQLRCGRPFRAERELCRRVEELNRDALRLVNGLIELKELSLRRVLSCRMFTMNYPLLLEHIIREAKLYRTFLCSVEQGGLDTQTMRETEAFWNRIMMEHALFIRGLLDPTEEELIKTSDGFAKDFEALLDRSRERNDAAIREDSLAAAKKIRDFKAAGAEGIENCKIRSVILPLLADHVLREANHYIRLLEK